MLATGGRALLGLLANTTLSGGGSVLMGDGGVSLIASYNGNVLTNVNNTIAGSGTIGAVSGVQLNNDPAGIIASTGSIGLQVGFDGPSVNAGLIESTGAGGLSLVGYDRSILTNTGKISVTGSGGLSIFETTIDDTKGGTLALVHGEALTLNLAAIVGGTLTNTVGGVVTVKFGPNAIETSTFTNNGQVNISAQNDFSTELSVQGTLVNSGTISLLGDSAADAMVTIASNTTLTGGGSVLMSDSAHNIIYGAASTDTLTNVNDTISGSGDVGDGKMGLINKAAGVIDSTGSAGMVLDTGANTIANAGTIEATGAGGLEIKSALNNTGLIEALGGNVTVDAAVTGKGSATVDGAILSFGSSFSQNVTFGATGALVLANSVDYRGNIRGFSTTGATSLDLRDIQYGAGITTVIKFNGDAAGGILLVSDGTHVAGIALVGDYTNSTFTASSDGFGGTLIVDPPRTASFATAMASFGAASPGSSQASNVALAAKPALATPATHSG